MHNLITFVALLSLATPSLADILHCTGTQTNWQAKLADDTATFQLLDRVGDYTVELTTPAKNDPVTKAYTLVGNIDTAILIVSPGRCNTADHTAYVLTQERSEAILLTGCCRLQSE